MIPRLDGTDRQRGGAWLRGNSPHACTTQVSAPRRQAL